MAVRLRPRLKPAGSGLSSTFFTPRRLPPPLLATTAAAAASASAKRKLATATETARGSSIGTSVGGSSVGGSSVGSSSVGSSVGGGIETAEGGEKGTAIVFMNMGGPSTLAEVQDFLSRLFADGDLIPLGRFQNYLGPLIAARRTSMIQHQYSVIGGGSPIRHWTTVQATETCKLLDAQHPATAPHRPYVAFRYAAPLTEETFVAIKASGVRRAVAFTQYPQYSCSTTGSSLNELWRLAKRYDPAREIRWSVIDRWPTHPGLVDAVASHVEAALRTYPAHRRDGVVLLFSAHSLPMSVVNRGDPYPQEVAATVHAVMDRLRWSNPYRLVWQSQVGPKPWLGAQTSATVEEYVKKGVTEMVLVPIAFTSDHIETLHELDREIIAETKQPGIKRAESLNGDPKFIAALADIARTHLESGVRASKQMALRCPMCTSERCRAQKEFFAGAGAEGGESGS